jgi:hypothetical protein
MTEGQDEGHESVKNAEPPLEATEEDKFSHLCRNGCGMTEGHLHYIKCQSAPTKIEQKKLQQRVISRLKKLRTNEGICSYIGHILSSISNNEEIEVYDMEVNTEDERMVIPALLGQQEIGWDEMLKGFVHIGWSRAQQYHYKRQGLESKLYCNKRWKREFLLILTDYSSACWKLRNRELHGDHKEEG